MHAGGFTAPLVGAALALGIAGSPLAAAPTMRTPALRAPASECDPRTGAMMRDFGFDPLPRVVRARSGGGVDVYLDGTPTITGVRVGGPASGRLESGDRVLAIDGLPVGTSAAAARYLRVERGEQVRFTVSRGGERHDVTITTGETCVPYPPAPTVTSGALAPDVPPPSTGAELLDPSRFGFAMQCDACGDATVAGKTVFRFDAPPIVVAVDPDSPAARAGVRAGDRLSQIDGVSLTGDEGWTTLRSLDRAASVRLTFIRNDVPFVVRLAPR